MCVCLLSLLLFIYYFFFGGGGGGEKGASPVQVKDSILLINGSLEGSSPYRTGVYIEYLLRILIRERL